MSADTKPRAWFYRLSRDFLRVTLRIRYGVRIAYRDRERVPVSGPLLVVANHVSFLDPPIISFAARNRFVRYLARDTLFTKPIANWFFRKSGVVPMDRTKGDVGALKLALKLLKDDQCVGMFPEGTRSDDGELKEAKGGVAFLIHKAAVPVLPMYIDGSYTSFPKGAEKIRPGVVTVYIGEPVDPASLTVLNEKGKPDYDQIGRKIMDRIAALKPRT